MPSKLASEDFLGSSEPTSPWPMMLGADDIIHLLFSPQCYFVLNTIDTPGAFDVKIMKKWNRWTYNIFILAIWFSTNYFGEPSQERSGLFPGISQTSEDELFSSLPKTNAKKC